MRLGVNIDHIATVRQARRGAAPDPVDAALVCERAGADSIVCHLREDRRHIQEADVRRLARTIATRLNLEMSIAPTIVSVALAVRPDRVTLVPERRQELTTEGGLDVVKLRRRVRDLVRAFRRRRVGVSLFVDPLFDQLAAARETGADAVELHTGIFANAANGRARRRALEALGCAARRAQALGLDVAAGHGLDYANIAPIRKIPEIVEVNIGFSIITRALTVGLAHAVAEMGALVRRSP